MKNHQTRCILLFNLLVFSFNSLGSQIPLLREITTKIDYGKSITTTTTKKFKDGRLISDGNVLYTYNEKKLLSQTRETTANGVAVRSYTYNNDGTLKTYEEAFDSKMYPEDNVTIIEEYTYTGDKITKKRYNGKSLEDQEEFTLINKTIINSTKKARTTANNIEYTYDENNNLVKLVKKHFNLDVLTFQSVTMNTYDVKPSVTNLIDKGFFGDKYKITTILTNNNFSERGFVNNIKVCIYTYFPFKSTTNYSYTYEENSYPKTLEYENTDHNKVTVNYVYE